MIAKIKNYLDSDTFSIQYDLIFLWKELMLIDRLKFVYDLETY